MPQEDDIGRLALYRDYYMSGWAVKEVTEADVRLLPLISGRGKGVRLMLTMGVARSLGDYDLIHRASLVNMKEFLTPEPEIKVYPAYKYKFGYVIVGRAIKTKEVKIFLTFS